MWKGNLLAELEHYWYNKNDVFDTLKFTWKFDSNGRELFWTSERDIWESQILQI